MKEVTHDQRAGLKKAQRTDATTRAVSPLTRGPDPVATHESAHAMLGNSVLAARGLEPLPPRAPADALQLQSTFGNAAVSRAGEFSPAGQTVNPAAYSSPLINQSQTTVSSQTAPDASTSTAVVTTMPQPDLLPPTKETGIDESLIELYPPGADSFDDTEFVTNIVFEEELIVAGGAGVDKEKEKKEEKPKEEKPKAAEGVKAGEEDEKEKEKKEKEKEGEKPVEKKEGAAEPKKAAAEGATDESEAETAGKAKKLADGKKKGGPAGVAESKDAKDVKAADAAPAPAAEAGASPEVAEWQTKVSQKTKAIKADGVGGGGRGGPKRIQASAAAAEARAAEERRKQQEGAGDILPNPPVVPDPLLPPTHDPVPAATDLVRKAAGQKLPNQTMPVLLRTKGNVMPDPPRTQFAPELGTKASTTYGKEIEVLDAQEKAATDSKNKKELKRIKKARKELDAKFKADWAEGKAEPLTLVEEEGPPPSPPLTEQTQADIGKVLAALTLMQETATQELVDQARSATYPNEVLREPEFDDFGKEGLEVAGPYLTNMIGNIGKAANLKKEDIVRYVAERKVALQQKTELVHGGLTDAAAFEKKKVQDLRQKQANEGAGVTPKIEEHVGRLAAEFKVGTDPKIVREKRDQLVTAVSIKQGQQTSAYDRAGERRQEALTQTQGAYLETYKNAVVTERAGYFKAAWKARKNKAKEKAAADAEAETLLAPTVSWLRDVLVPGLDVEFARMKKQAADAVKGFITNLKDAVESAIEMIGDWANDLTGKLGKFWLEIGEESKDWEIQARESAKAWEAARAGAARDGLVQDLNAIRMVTRNEEEELKQQQAAAAKKLTTQGDKTKEEAINSPAGSKDAILTVATQLKERLFGEERPKIVEKFQEKFEDLGPDRWHEVDAVAQVVEPGGQTADWIGEQVRDATDRIGTEESQIYTALANLGPIRARAVRLYYRKEYDDDIEDVLKGELSGAEEDRAIGLLNRDPGKAEAATIAYAINPAIHGGGDVSAVMDILRETKDPADLRAKFKAEYGYDLDEYLRHSLGGAEFTRAQEFLTGDPTTRYVAELKHSVKSEDRKGVEAVYASIRAEVEQKAAKHSEEVRSGLAGPQEQEWDSKRIEEEVKKRMAEVETAYNEKEQKTASIFGSTLRNDIDKNFKGPERDLALALQDGNVSQANAARLKMEDKYEVGVDFWTGFPDVKTGDSKVINGILTASGERAKIDVQRDEEIKLWNKRTANAREQQVAYLRSWTPEQMKGLKWDEEAERKKSQDNVEKETKNRALEYKDEIVKSYDANYGGEGSLKKMLDRNVYGEQRGKAAHLIEQGGILNKAQTLHYAVVEKNADAVKDILGSTPEKELETLKTEWAESEEGKKWLDEHKSEGKTADDFILSKFDGDNKEDIKSDIKGLSDDPEEMLRRKQAKLKRQEDRYLLASGDAFAAAGGGKDYELRRLKREVARLEGQVNHLKTLDKGSDAYKFAKRSYERQLAYVDRAVEGHRKAVDRRTNDAAMIVGIIVTAVIIVATGGAATPLLAALAAGAGAAASIITKALMKGGSYVGTKEMWTDIVVGVVDTIVSAATAGLGAKLLKGIGPLAKMSQSTKLVPRLLAHGLAEGAENFVSAIPTSVAQQLMEKGELSFSATFTGAAIGAGLGGVMGSIGGFKKPGKLAGATSDVLAHRGTPKQRLADWKLFKQANPEKTYKEFLSELDGGILSKQAKEATEREAQRKMRRELFEHIPPAQRGQFKDVPIKRVSDVEFEQFTHSVKGQAVVIIKDGKPMVLIRESANFKALREEGVHLLQSIDPRKSHLFRALDEKKMAKWPSLSLDEQLSLLGKKLDLELDGQQRIIKKLEDRLASAGDDPKLRKEILGDIEEARHTVDNLTKRFDEVGKITPQQRIAWKRDPSLRPGYLDQPARLFTKPSAITPRGRAETKFLDDIANAGLDASASTATLRGLRTRVSGSPVMEKLYRGVAAKAAELGPKKGIAYIEKVGELLQSRPDKFAEVAGFLKASAQAKNPTKFLEAAIELSEKGARLDARLSNKALGEVVERVAKLSGTNPTAALKFLDDVGDLIDSFRPKSAGTLSGFVTALAKMDDPGLLLRKLKTFAANPKNRLGLTDRTTRLLSRTVAKLPSDKAAKFLDAVNDFTGSFSTTRIKELEGFIVGATRRAKGDASSYFQAVKDLVAARKSGLSQDALDILAAKVGGPLTKEGREMLDVEWLVKTDLFQLKEARMLLNRIAEDSNTAWWVFKLGATQPKLLKYRNLSQTSISGIIGEYLTFLRSKQIAAGIELVGDAAGRKTMRNLKKNGILDIISSQVPVGSSKIDFLASLAVGNRGLELKNYSKDFWISRLKVWDKMTLKGRKALNPFEREVIKTLDHIIKQVNDAKSLGTPFLMLNDMVDKIGPHWQKAFQNFRSNLPGSTVIIKLPAEDVLRGDIWLHKLLGISKRRK